MEQLMGLEISSNRNQVCERHGVEVYRVLSDI